MLWDERERLIALDDAYPIAHGMYLLPEFYSEVGALTEKSFVNIFSRISLVSISDDDGREVRRIDLDIAQECNTGDPEEEQFRVVVRRALPQRVHNGAAQAWRATLQWIEGSRHRSSPTEGSRRRFKSAK